MSRLPSRAAALLVAFACLVWPLAPALALPCASKSAMAGCAHCKRPKAQADRKVAAPKPQCCLSKSTGEPMAPATLTERVSPHIDAAPPPARPAVVVPARALAVAHGAPRALPPRVLQRNQPLLN